MDLRGLLSPYGRLGEERSAPVRSRGPGPPLAAPPDGYRPLEENQEEQEAKDARKLRKKEKLKKVKKGAGRAWKCLLLGLSSLALAGASPVTAACFRPPVRTRTRP